LGGSTSLSKVNEDSEFDIRNSYECAEKLQSIQLPPGYILISLDVMALFDSIPPQLAKKAIEEEWDTIKDRLVDPPKTSNYNQQSRNSQE
jgi:hypothetical protein